MRQRYAQGHVLDDFRRDAREGLADAVRPWLGTRGWEVRTLVDGSMEWQRNYRE